MKIDENNFSILDNASKITDVDYEIKWFDAENIDGYIETNNLLDIIQDLIYEYNNLKEKLEDVVKDRDENYAPKKFDPYEEYGISEDDFH